MILSFFKMKTGRRILEKQKKPILTMKTLKANDGVVSSFLLTAVIIVVG